MTSNEAPCYRIDFALTVLAGNLSRYQMLRPLVESDSTVRARWYPLRTWVPNDPLRFLPSSIRVRARNVLDSLPLFLRPPGDAVVLHAFETYYLFVLFDRLLRRNTVIVENNDAAVAGNPKGVARSLCRFAVKRTDLFVPFSQWAGSRTKTEFPEIPSHRIRPLHPGIVLDQWPFRPTSAAKNPFGLLFVGGDLVRKGIEYLLDAHEQSLHQTCELHIATQSSYLSPTLKHRIINLPHVTLHLDLLPGSEKIRQLYAQSDAFVLPTLGDASPWVALEAMATGVPVIICPHGGIPDIVQDGATGLLIPPRDANAIVNAVDRLRQDPMLRERLTVQARAHVENNFDAVKNTKCFLDEIKAIIDERRRGA
jgi:glycosyltransferase involved in cell wall biosynthesis